MTYEELSDEKTVSREHTLTSDNYLQQALFFAANLNKVQLLHRYRSMQFEADGGRRGRGVDESGDYYLWRQSGLLRDCSIQKVTLPSIKRSGSPPSINVGTGARSRKD